MPLYFVLAAVLVAIDQGVKYFVRESIPLHTAVDFLPGLDLTYVQNTGAAFYLFSQHTWILALLSVVVSVVLVIALARRLFPQWWGMLARGQPHRPGALWLCHRHVCHHLYELPRL